MREHDVLTGRTPGSPDGAAERPEVVAWYPAGAYAAQPATAPTVRFAPPAHSSTVPVTKPAPAR